MHIYMYMNIHTFIFGNYFDVKWSQIILDINFEMNVSVNEQVKSRTEMTVLYFILHSDIFWLQMEVQFQ